MNSQDDEVLARLVTGELRVDSGAARELFARRPELRESIDELRGLTARLNAEGASERGVIESARAGVSAADVDAVRAAAGPSRHAQISPRVSPVGAEIVPWVLVVAAAVLIAAGAFLLTRDKTRSADSEYLNDKGARAEVIELSLPTEPLAVGDRITWSGSANGGRLELAQRWLLEFHSVASTDRSASLLLTSKTQETEWTLTDADFERLSDQVLLTIHRVDSDNRHISSSPSHLLSLAR